MGINKIILAGNVGRDPDVRKTQKGTSVVTINLAVSSRIYDKEAGTKEHTEWFRVVVMGGLANVAEAYVTKGSKVSIVGRIQTREWVDKDGEIQRITEVIAEDLELGDRGAAKPAEPAKPRTAPAKALAPVEANPFEDDIPF